jgi:hypothetical protein
MNAWSQMMTLAVRSVLTPRMGASSGFEPSVVAFDPVVRVLLGVVDPVGDQLGDDVRQRRGPVGDDVIRFAVRGERGREEPARRGDIAAFGDQHVDDLAVFVDGLVHVTPDTGDLDVGLIDEPARADRAAAWSRCVDQQRREALHPPKQGDVIDVDAALREELLEIAVRQTEAEIPTHRQQDHL